MHISMTDEAHGRGRTAEARTTPSALQAELRKAFREWLDASKEWSALQRRFGDAEPGPENRRRLAELEQQVEATAEAFAEAKQRCSESPLYMAMLYGTISGTK